MKMEDTPLTTIPVVVLTRLTRLTTSNAIYTVEH